MLHQREPRPHAAVVDWSTLPFLLALARHGSASAAARALGVSVTTVGRRIGVLESELGLRLVDRTAEGMIPTVEGRRVAELAEAVEERVHDLERAVAGQAGHEPRGTVRVSATELVCAELVAPALVGLRRQHPHLCVELVSDADRVSLARRESDLAVRNVRPEGQSLVIRRLGTIPLGLFAVDDYLLHRAETDDLRKHALLGYDDSYGPIPEVTWFTERGLQDAFALRTNSTRTLLHTCLDGLGIALLPTFWATGHPALRPVPTRDPLPTRTIWVAYHEDLRDAPAVQVTVRHLVDAVDARLKR